MPKKAHFVHIRHAVGIINNAIFYISRCYQNLRKQLSQLLIKILSTPLFTDVTLQAKKERNKKDFRNYG